MNKRNRRVKKDFFWHTYATILSIVLILIAAGLFIFYRYMAAYEAAQPQNTADAYAEVLTEDSLISLVTDSLGDIEFKYEKLETFTDIFKTAYNENSPIARKLLVESTSETPVFSILCGKTEVCRVTLEKSGNGSFGFETWQVAKAEASTDGILENATDFEVYVPHGAELLINGIAADDAEKDIKYPMVTDLENTVLPSADLYKTGTLYSEVEFTCTLDGEECVTVTKDNTVYYLPRGYAPNNYTITAPAGAEVYVNGILLDESYVTKADVPYDYSTLEQNNSSLPTCTVYETGELFHTPEVSCQMAGFTLDSSVSGTACTFEYPKNLMYTLEVKVPAGSVVTVGGTELSAVVEPVTESAFEGLIADSTGAPVFDVYTVDDLYCPVTGITATLDGTELTFSDVSVGNSLKFVSDHSGIIDEAVSAYAIEFMKAYFFYTSEGSRNVDENLAATLVYVDPTSNLYTKIKESRIGYYYLTPVISQVYNKLEASQMYLLADGSYIVKLDFDITQTHYGGIKEHSGEISLHITGSGDNLKIADMVIDAE